MPRRPPARTAGRPAARTTDAPARPSVRDFTGGAGFSVEWDVRPVYDFLFSLSGDAGSTDDLPSADRTWLTEAKASLPKAVRAAALALFENEIGIHIASLAVDRPDIRTPEAFVAAVESLTPADLLRAIFTETPHEPDEAAAEPSASASHPEPKRDHAALLRDPEGTHRDVVAVLRGWLTPFSSIGPRVIAMIERDHAMRATDRATLDDQDLIEKTTGGIRWLAEPGVRRVILAPSYFSRPYNFLLAGANWRLFGYPIADDALDVVDPLAPPQSVVRLHRALGDETRLRILKLLATRDLYLTEIAQQLELSKPTIKHHLALLRAAGLVTITESGTVMYYSLRRPRLDDASKELQGFLTGGRG